MGRKRTRRRLISGLTAGLLALLSGAAIGVAPTAGAGPAAPGAAASGLLATQPNFGFQIGGYTDPRAVPELLWRLANQNSWGINGNVNVQTSWFDITTEPGNTDWKRLLTQKENYVGRVVTYNDNPALFKALKIAPDRVLLEILTRNLVGQQHSEQFLVNILKQLSSKYGIDLAPRWIALNSSRMPCGATCASLIPQNVRVSYLVRYLTAAERSLSATRITQLVNNAISEFKAQVKAAQSSLDAMLPPGGSCPVDGGPGKRLAIGAVLLAAADCGGSKANASSASGLRAALENPGAQDLGGVDFSTLQLQYLADLPGDDGKRSVRYAFSATGDGADPALGAQVLRESTSDFLTWLAIPPERFTVNLNPTEPDRVIDPVLGRTQAGKALLEADYRMKRTDAELTHPDTALGEQYWGALRSGPNGQVCVSNRTWIVPGAVTVHESGDELYILDAKLKLLSEAEHLKAAPDSGIRTCPAGDPAIEEHNQRAYESMVLPRLEKVVNTAPEYAPLRRAYLGRVAAEWIRQRHAKGIGTSYDAVIDSNDVSRWQLTDGWTPRQTYDAFVKSYKEGDFTVVRREQQGNVLIEKTFVSGGVDFTKLPQRRVDDTEFGRLAPGRADLARGALSGPRANGDQLWLGGETTASVPTDPAVTRFRRAMSGRTGLVALVGGGALVLLLGMGFLGPRRRATGTP